MPLVFVEQREQNNERGGERVMSQDVQQEQTYWSKEIADLLQIGTSTLRKWCLQLEERGYTFLRDGQERRAFTERDVMALRLFRELTKDKGITLENAADAVIARVSRHENASVTPSVLSTEERSDKRYEDLLEKINKLVTHTERQDAFNTSLLEKLEEQQRYLEESVRARDERLVQAVREMQETRLLLATTQEEKKKSLWQRIFQRG